MRRIEALALVALAVAGCGGDGNPAAGDAGDAPRSGTGAEVVLVEDLPADLAKTGTLTYYSLRAGAMVDAADSNSTAWDLALRGTTILTNGGSSGPGQGAAAVLTAVAFDVLTAVPDALQLRSDRDGEPAIPGPSWYNYTGSEGTPPHAILPTPGVVLLVRTADGRHAKVEILSYYKSGAPVPVEGDEARHYYFRYQMLD